MGSLLLDIRYIFRAMRRCPGFAVIAIAALALGIGANSAIFSVVNAVILKPLPYPHPRQLVELWMRFTGIGIPNDQNAVSPPEFQDLQVNRSLSSLAAVNDASFNVNIGGMPERVEAALVSTSFFPMLGVEAQVGRVFLPDEGRPGHEHVVLLSDGIWRRRFGADPSVPGRKLVMNGQSYIITGVLPRWFQMPRDSDVWVPLVFSADDLSPNERGSHYLSVVARIKDGITLQQARSDLAAVGSRIIQENPKYPYQKYNFMVLAVPLLEQEIGDTRPPCGC